VLPAKKKKGCTLVNLGRIFDFPAENIGFEEVNQAIANRGILLASMLSGTATSLTENR
jgi:hypothetical protein